MANSRLFIGSLAPDVTTRDVEHFFRKYGRIREIVLKTGYGFVVIFCLLSKNSLVFCKYFFLLNRTWKVLAMQKTLFTTSMAELFVVVALTSNSHDRVELVLVVIEMEDMI